MRSMEGDDSERQRIKQELYATQFVSPTKQSKRNDENQNDTQGQQPQEDTTQLAEENKKTYRALLQNQVLGIQNEHLLHEIHNSEDYICQQATYSQIQQNAENMDLADASSPTRTGANSNGSPLAGAEGSPIQYRVNNYMHNTGGQNNSDMACKGAFSSGNTDLSPYNSKFTVLRFSQQKRTSSGFCQGKAMSNLRPFELSPEEVQEPNTMSDRNGVIDSAKSFQSWDINNT